MHFNNVIGTVNRYVIQIKRDKFPSWTGGVPRQMNEVNLLRRGGGIYFATTPHSSRFAGFGAPPIPSGRRGFSLTRPKKSL